MLTKSSTETKAFASRLARIFLKTKNFKLKTGALVVALVGDLGAGKTTFAQGFARGLGIRQPIVSPTFLIFRKYIIPKSSKLIVNSFKFFYHVDLYRIKNFKELQVLSFKKILTDPKNIVLIEWAERARRILPKNTTIIRFQHGKNPNNRDIFLKSSIS